MLRCEEKAARDCWGEFCALDERLEPDREKTFCSYLCFLPLSVEPLHLPCNREFTNVKTQIEHAKHYKEEGQKSSGS